MHEEREAPHLSARRVESGAEGVIVPDAMAELLPRGWSHDQRYTRAGLTHIFTRPVSVEESDRLDFEQHQNHRHTLGLTEADGTQLLTYIVLRYVHTEDHRALERLEAALSTEERLTREDFKEVDLEIFDRIWMQPQDLRDELKMGKETLENRIARLADRFGVSTRAELMVEGLRRGLIDPDLEHWYRSDWPSFSPLQQEALRRAHWKSPFIAEATGMSARAVRNRIQECYEKIGVTTRAELILAGLANREFHLSEIPTERRQRPLTDAQKEVLGLIDRPVSDIAKKRRKTPGAIVQTIYKTRSRLGLDNYDELIAYAFARGYIDNAVDESLADVFSEYQCRMMSLILPGNQALADRYKLSEVTIARRVRAMKDACGATDRRELILYGLRAGLIDMDAD